MHPLLSLIAMSPVSSARTSLSSDISIVLLTVEDSENRQEQVDDVEV